MNQNEALEYPFHNDGKEIVIALLPKQWHKDCLIIPKYMPPFPRHDTKPMCVIRYKTDGPFLRYSKGPCQGYFWDAYGEDMHSIEQAIVALSWASKPGDV